jgi:hypothetical protein
MLTSYFYLLGLYDARFEWIISLGLILVFVRVVWPTIIRYENRLNFVRYVPSLVLLAIWVLSIGPTFS